MLRFYEMMYYAIYRQRLEGKVDGFHYATRFYTFLVFLNATTLLFLLNSFLQTRGILSAKSEVYCFLAAILLGFGMDALMGRRAAKVKAKFENQDWSGIATWLMVYLVFSFASFLAVAIAFDYM